MSDERPEAHVVKARHVVSHPISQMHVSGGGDAGRPTPPPSEGGPTPTPRNDFRVALVPLKRQHTRPGSKKIPTGMSDL